MTVLGSTATFFQEVAELLEQVEASALVLEASPQDADVVNALFRAFHTIKGSAGMVGLDAVSAFTHHVETTLDRVRDGRVAITPQLVSLILSAKDHIESLVHAAKHGQEATPAAGQPIVDELVRLCAGSVAKTAHSEPPAPRIRTDYRVVFWPHRDAFRQGLDPTALMSDLHALGPCQIACKLERVPPLAELTPDSCEMGWEISLTTTADEAAIRDVFIFFENESALTIERGMSAFLTDPPLRAAGSGSAVPVAPPLHTDSSSPQPGAGPAEARVEKAQRKVEKGKSAAASSTVRVASERLDQLVQLVGELVINQSRLQQAYALGNPAEMAGPVEAMDRLIAEVRDSVFGIRMMPIGTTFNRFQRLVRDTAAELEKEIELITEGAETELDKNVLDQLGDPLVHLIRNSIDHGLETPAERLAAGKPRMGRVLLKAAHDGGQVVITIQDDGRGLDRAAIRAKAEEKGLIEPTANLSDQEIFDLIMRPGFSTAAAVTQLSGRGVGMDVVKKTVEGLRGSLQISSERGRGTTMRLSLPLTLAIIDGLLVEIARDRFIVPMAAVMENLELARADREANNRRNVVAVRGELVPYVRLRELFSCTGPEQEIEKVVIVTSGGQRVGLVVDRVIGSHQTVIQPLGRLCRNVALFSGTTIMGDGRVAMILDLAGTFRHAARNASSLGAD